MADIATFPTLATLMTGDESLLGSDKGPFQDFIFAAAATADQVVVFGSTDGEVTPAVGSLTERVAGIAVYDVALGAIGAVAMAGNIVKCVNASGSVAIPQGTWVITDDNPVKGTVSAINTDPSGVTATLYLNTVGITKEEIPAGGSGYVLILPVPITVPNAT